MKNTILLLITVIISHNCIAQSHSHATPEDIVANFFTVYEKAGLKTGLDTIFSYGDKSVMKALDYIKDTLAGTVKPLGKKYLGYELINKKNVTASYSTYSYIGKYPAGPLRFNFIFYKPEDKWVLIDFSFESNLTYEARDIMRLH